MNTTMQAKSTFSEGLIMDFSPDNTLSSTLTSALNATLLTFNGNELALQNDMGNGRVETAYLPEGYIPVGTCEFGDIIYIVSYNPIKNKSLIGCFPSPERNISSNEIGGTKQIIKATDFLELDESGNPTGKLKLTSCKKILFLKDLNPGDKYLISATNLDINKDSITDYGNTSHQYGEFVKLFKIHVVSIEDSGKINYLDSSVKWYNNDYFIADTPEGLEVPDIDSFRSKINSGYSIFQSKISGKLALLIELEKIKSFSCTYLIYTKDSSVVSLLDSLIENKNFDIYWFLNWESDNPNISPSHIVLTKSLWSGKNKNNAGKVFYYTKNLDGLYIIDYDNGGEQMDSATLPTSYNSNNYWYKKISTCIGYQLIKDYNSFLLYGYDKLSTRRLEEIALEQYGNSKLPLYKINLQISYKGTPSIGENTYYVNVNYYDNDKYYTTDNNGSYIEITPKILVDDIVNNYFKNLICKKFSTFSIPYRLILDGHTFKPDISNLIYNYAITPAMSYGLLEEFTLEGFIDFSKIGSGEINLTDWRYYNTENISTLTIGLDVYPEPNKGVSEITIDFYDNLGIAATYRISNKSSYSGQFIEYIPLNNSTSNYKLSDLDSNNNKIYHAGLLTSIESENTVFKTLEGKVYPIYKKDNEYYYKTSTLSILIDPSRDQNNIYTNDAGIIYSNIVYLTKITVKYGPKNAIGEYNNNTGDYRYFTRWYWTNNMFNEYYYNTKDFELLKPVLNLDVGASYSSNKYWKVEERTYESIETDNNLSAIVLAINLNGDYDTLGNINNSIIIGLLDTYNTFSINKDRLDDFLMKIFLGLTYIQNSKDPIEVKYTDYLISNINDFIMPNNYIPDLVNNSNEVYNGKMNLEEMSPTLSQLLNCGQGLGSELWENPELYKNRFSINFSDSAYGSIGESSIGYINLNLEYIDLDHVLCISKDGLTEEFLTKNPLVFSGIHFSKYYKEFTTEKKNCDVYTPILNSTSDLDKYGLLIIDNHLYFKELVTIGGSRSGLNGNQGGFYATIHSSDSHGAFTPEYNDNVYYRGNLNGNIGIVKNSKASLKVWENQYEGKNFKDMFNYNIVPILISSSVMDDASIIPTTLYFIIDDTYTSDNLVVSSDIWAYSIPLNYTINIGYNSPDLDKNTVDSVPPSYKFEILGRYKNRKLFIMGLAMKDIDGEIHILNSFFPVVALELGITNSVFYLYNVTLQIKWDRYLGYTTIGDIVSSILSNIYIKLSNTLEVDVTNEANIVYLDNHTTQFTLDIIYDVLVREDISLLSDILILGYNFQSYIEEVKNSAPDITVNDNNILPVILKIIKNIPLQINLSYKTPITTLNQSLVSAVVRKNTDNKLTQINSIQGLGPLFTLDNNDNMILATLVNCGTINNVVNDGTSGYVVNRYNNLLVQKNNQINLLFTYKDGLVLKRTSLPSQELAGFMTDLEKLAVCGLSITEYLTESLKVLSR